MLGMAGEVDVIIIGAGAAGLAAVRRLQEAHVSALVLEARNRIGGRAMTRPTRLGHPIDLGCEWLHSADRNPWTGIARGLGLSIDENLPDWSNRVARHQGTSAQVDWGDAYGNFEERLEIAAKGREDGPAAEFLPRDGRWNALLNAVSTWANGVELDRLSIHDHARYADTGINWRVLEGYGALIAGYGAPGPVHMETVVHRIDHRSKHILVATNRGELRTRAVIVTVPPTLLASEAVRFTPTLPDKVDAAHGLPLGIANKLFLELRGPGEDFPIDRHVLGKINCTATGSYQLRPHGRRVIVGYFGGQLAKTLEREGVVAMTAFALDELAGLFGSDMRRRLHLLASSAWADDPFCRGSYSYALPGHAGDRARLAAPIDERIFFAGEACSTEDFSTAHGAYRTGRAAADQVLAALEPLPLGEAQQLG